MNQISRCRNVDLRCSTVFLLSLEEAETVLISEGKQYIALLRMDFHLQLFFFSGKMQL